MYESISSNPPLPFDCICSLSVLWNPLQVANPSVRREKHPQQFSTSTATNVCSLNAKLQSKQNIIQHTKQSLRVFCSLSTVSVCSILHTPKPWPLRPRSREEETTAAPHQHKQLLMYSASENFTLVLKCESINLLRFFWSLTIFCSQQERCNWNLYRYEILLKIATYEERETLNHSTSTWTTPSSAASKNLTST